MADYSATIPTFPDTPENYHIVTVQLTGDQKRTLVSLAQDHNATEQEREHSQANWGMMLEGLRNVVEQEK